jgi:uncharacterized membrane protein YedE/YeeE
MQNFLSLITTHAHAGTLFTLPDATTTLAAAGAWSSPIFNDFLPLIYVLIGILVPAIVIGILLRLFHHS